MKLFYHWVNVTIIVIICGLLGLAIGLMCGCCPNAAQAEDKLAMVGFGYPGDNTGGVRGFILDGPVSLTATLGGNSDQAVLWQVGVLLRMPALKGLDVTLGADAGMRSFFQAGNLWIGTLYKDAYGDNGKHRLKNSGCPYFASDVRGGLMVRSQGAVIQMEAIGYYFQINHPREIGRDWYTMSYALVVSAGVLL